MSSTGALAKSDAENLTSQSSHQTSSRTRLAGLLIVLAVAIIPFLMASTMRALGVTVQYSLVLQEYRYCNALVIELTSLALLFYVLHQNGQTLSNLSIAFRAGDIGHGILLIIGSFFLFAIGRGVISFIYSVVTGHLPPPATSPFSGTGLIVLPLAVAIVNPFFEELIVRAFVICETTALTGSATLAIVLSVVLQTAYHLYQGVSNAAGLGLVFLMFSLYYLKTKRLWPVILAHLWSDASATLYYLNFVHH